MSAVVELIGVQLERAFAKGFCEGQEFFLREASLRRAISLRGECCLQSTRALCKHGIPLYSPFLDLRAQNYPSTAGPGFFAYLAKAVFQGWLRQPLLRMLGSKAPREKFWRICSPAWAKNAVKVLAICCWFSSGIKHVVGQARGAVNVRGCCSQICCRRIEGWSGYRHARVVQVRGPRSQVCGGRVEGQ